MQQTVNQDVENMIISWVNNFGFKIETLTDLSNGQILSQLAVFFLKTKAQASFKTKLRDIRMCFEFIEKCVKDQCMIEDGISYNDANKGDVFELAKIAFILLFNGLELDLREFRYSKERLETRHVDLLSEFYGLIKTNDDFIPTTVHLYEQFLSKSKNAEQRHDNEQIQNLLKEKEESLLKMSNEIAFYKEELNKQKETHFASETRFTNEIELLNKDAKLQEAAKAEIKNQLEATRKENNHLKRGFNEIREQTQKFEEQYNKKKQAYKQSQADLTEAIKRLEQYEIKIQQQASQIKELNGENAQKTKEYELLSERYKLLRVENNTLLTSVNILERKVNEKGSTSTIIKHESSDNKENNSKVALLQPSVNKDF